MSDLNTISTPSERKRMTCQGCGKKRMCGSFPVGPDGEQRALCVECQPTDTTPDNESTEPFAVDSWITGTQQDGYSAFGPDGGPIGALASYPTYADAAKTVLDAHGQGGAALALLREVDAVDAAEPNATEAAPGDDQWEEIAIDPDLARAIERADAEIRERAALLKERDDAPAIDEREADPLTPQRRAIVEAALEADRKAGEKLAKAYLAFAEAEAELLRVGVREPEAWRDLARASDSANRALYRASRAIADLLDRPTAE